MAFNYYQPYQYVQPQQQTLSFQQSMINGKIVDGIDVVRGFDIPLGSYGVFPKADMSAVYIKTWTENGTTRIDEYQRLQVDSPETITLSDIQNSIADLEKKIDGIKAGTSSPTARKKKAEVTEDE